MTETVEELLREVAGLVSEDRSGLLLGQSVVVRARFPESSMAFGLSNDNARPHLIT